MKNFTYLCRKAICIIGVLLFSQFAAKSQQVARGLTASNGQFIGFYEYTPTDYNANPAEKYPIIIFLHGIGERGNGTSELPNVLGQGIPRYIKNGATMRFFWNGKYETFLVLSPQLSTSYGDWKDFYVDEMLKYARTNLRIDTNRIYLTGLSLGGGGVWHYATASLNNAKTFAAIAPVCGTCSVVSACNIASANLPTWAFHATDDGVVGVGCTTSAIQNINNCSPAVKPLMTLYKDGGHFIWDRAMDIGSGWQDPNLYEWFLGQNKSLGLNKLPTANAGSNITVTLPTTTVTLDASASVDPDGSIAKVLWRKISGPGVGNILSPNGITSSLTGLITQGVYQYELTVVDSRAAVARDTVTVTVNAGAPGYNLPPIAVAGGDQTITTNSATITSWGSSDPDGSIVSYLWTKVSGPSTYTMPNNIYASCGINGMVSGVYEFELKVTDNRGAEARDTVKITVNLPGPPPANQSPIAKAGADISITLPTSTVTLNGASSNDPDGSISSYGWSLVSGPGSPSIVNPGAASTAVNNLSQGTYLFRLLVTDNGGATGSDTVRVTVNAAPPPPNQAPVAKAGSDISITLPVSSATLNGSASYDPDGSISSTNWSKISGPAQYNISAASQISTSLTNLAQGTYQFRLVVTDNQGATASDTVQVTVNAAPPPPNQAPVAKAGSDISITLPVSSTTLNGSASYDPDGSIMAFAWTKISGPAQYTINSPAQASTALTNLAQGVYTFRLQVTDNQGAWHADTVQVTVSSAPPPPNQAPIARAGNDASITLPVNNSSLDGSYSSDADGTIVSYNWIKISGPSQFTLSAATSAKTNVTNLVQGTYLFRLVVTDNQGGTASDTVQLIVNAAPPPPNQAPVANAGSNQSITLPANSVNLSAAASSDPDGSISSYAWTQISGPANSTILNPANISTAINSLVQGTYRFRLQVTDNQGASNADTVQITVNAAPIPPNQAPVANAGSNRTITLPNNSSTLDGTASTDADGSISSYSWTKISGPASYTLANAAAASTIVSNLIEGVYQFRLQVTDNKGASSTASITITVLPKPNEAPIANAGADFSVYLPNPSIFLNGSTSTDPDGTIVSYSWVKISGPGAITIVNSTTQFPTVVGVLAGDYLFELTVTDDKGAKSKATVRVTVLPIPNERPVANAGEDITIAYPASSTSLNGTGSYDSDGTINAYIWKQVAGPSTASLSASAQPVCPANNLALGDYLFELTVVDDRGASSSDTVKVIVVNNFRYEEKLIIYPNPAGSIINLRCMSDSMGKAIVNIYNMNGNLVHQAQIEKTQAVYDKPMNIAHLQSGTFYVEVIIDNIVIANRKKMVAKFVKL